MSWADSDAVSTHIGTDVASSAIGQQESQLGDFLFYGLGCFNGLGF